MASRSRRRDAATVRHFIRSGEARLQPGVYIIDGSTARKVGQSQLPSLRGSSQVIRRETGWRFPLTVYSYLSSGLDRYVRQEHPLTDWSSWTILVVGQDYQGGPKYRYFDAEFSRTMVEWSEDALSKRYEEVRSEYTAFVKAPSFSILSSHLLEEEVVMGRHLDRVSRRIADTSREWMIRQHRVLATEATRSCGDYQQGLLHDVFSKLRKHPWPSNVSLEASHQLVSESPWSVSQGDLGYHNILVSDSGPVVIDFEPSLIGYRPAWFDITHMLLHDKPASWAQMFAANSYRELLAAAAPGLSPVPSEIAIAYQVIKSMPNRGRMREVRSSPPDVDRVVETVRSNLQAMWTR